MQNFIVLGIIPGTHYQTTFLFWVYVALGLVGLVLLLKLFRMRHRLHVSLSMNQASDGIDQFEAITI